jgi:hypothetical protein
VFGQNADGTPTALLAAAGALSVDEIADGVLAGTFRAIELEPLGPNDEPVAVAVSEGSFRCDGELVGR